VAIRIVVVLLWFVASNMLVQSAMCWSVSHIQNYGQISDRIISSRQARRLPWSAATAAARRTLSPTATCASNNIDDIITTSMADVVVDASCSERTSDSDESDTAGGRNELTNAMSPLSMTLQDLAMIVDGKGRAQIVWNMLRRGIDPLDEHHQASYDMYLGAKALSKYKEYFNNQRIEESVLKILKSTRASSDGTTKLLLQLQASDDDDDSGAALQVESVIIPWPDRKRSTLCISSQVGCRQACTFCQTGRMGKLRSLSADEILGQVFLANLYVAASQTRQACKCCNEDNARKEHVLYPIDNIVFMGMGEPADNSHAVVQAARILTHPAQFQLAPRRVTISTVGIEPDSFVQLGQAPAVLAWSVHASRNEIRKQLVPTTSYTMEELREGLIETLLRRSRRMRATMLEVTLLDGINDSLQDAQHLAEFCKPLVDRVAGIKLVINLIPWNQISATFGPASHYRQPSADRVQAFQRTIMEHGILCYVRTTRGDDESAACGQLATTNKKGEQ
jgi:23S rRNA (adenine2503-C2)-methyltransferase